MGKLMSILAAPGALRTLRAVRAMLDEVTPLTKDCGRLCNHACCKPDDTEENGMLLLPYEDRFYRKPIEGFAYHLIDDDSVIKGGKRLVCEGACLREHRPIACRIFPLRMRITEDAQQETSVQAEVDPRAWAICPLPEEGGLRAMRKDFIDAVEGAGVLLCKNVYMLDALLHEQTLLDEQRTL